MKNLITSSACLVFLTFVLSSCLDTEDPGPIQETTKEFALIDFDRLEMGSAFNITVEQGTSFSVKAKGDRRNINDLEVYKSGTTLVIEYDEFENRNHQTYITITMPELSSFNFSGASVSVVSGFESDGTLDVYLSGASVCQLDAGYGKLNTVVSGASTLKLHGLGDVMTAEVSGASVLSAFEFPVREAQLNASGASKARLTVSDNLSATATGASDVIYRGNPQVVSNASGGSSVIRD